MAVATAPFIRPPRLKRTALVRVCGCPRPISSSRGHGREVEKFHITCASSGSITLDLYNSSALSSPSSPLVIHLPPTGTHKATAHPPIPSYLFSASAALVSINYRWHNPFPSSPNARLLSSNAAYNHHHHHHPFPTPLHDTLHAYQYLLTTLLPRLAPPPQKQDGTGRTSLYARPTPRKQPLQRPILIYGSFVGGSIATSLALTESFASKSLPTKIAGLITKNAVFDWTQIATTIAPTTPERQDEDIWDRASAAAWDAATLHALKTHLFVSPASAFDAFASPTQFFRSPGLAVPPTWPVPSSTSTSPASSTPASAASTASETEPFLTPHSGLDYTRTAAIEPPLVPDQDSATERLLKRLSEMQVEPSTRSAPLKFPSAASGLRIPHSLFLFTPSSTSASSTSKPARKKSRARSTSTSREKDVDVKVNADRDADSAITPGSQAETMAALLRRSVFVHELSASGRKGWGGDGREGMDPEAASEERAVSVGVGPGLDGKVGENAGEREEEKVVREWIEDVLG